ECAGPPIALLPSANSSPRCQPRCEPFLKHEIFWPRKKQCNSRAIKKLRQRGKISARGKIFCGRTFFPQPAAASHKLPPSLSSREVFARSVPLCRRIIGCQL